MEIQPVAHIHSDFSTKFGVPRQSGLAPDLTAEIILNPPYDNMEAVRGMEGFSHLWLIWEFSENRGKWSLSVRPPRLGGNRYMGVFATRSPFRPNGLGLSCVRLVSVEEKNGVPVIIVAGADLVDGTPVYDIKPYVPYADCIPDAIGGFASAAPDAGKKVDIPEDLKHFLPENKMAALAQVLAQDPRPAFHNDPERIYGFGFCGREVKFKVSDTTVQVISIE